jgi:two-component system, cell cycle sensor histidine kinase and response regulator CckA
VDRTSAQGNETILLVEDTDAVRTVLRRALENQGYVVLEASGGAEALEVVRSYSRPIHLLVTDVRMPEMTGLELASRMRTLRPKIKVLLIPGDQEERVTGFGNEGAAVAALEKPFTGAALARKVRELLDS